MTVPSFQSVEEADAWFGQQARAQQRDVWLDAHDAALRIGACVRWAGEDGKTVISYTRAKVGTPPRFVLVVRRPVPVMAGERPVPRVIYIRAFAKRADAKKKAQEYYAKASPRWAKRNGYV